MNNAHTPEERIYLTKVDYGLAGPLRFPVKQPATPKTKKPYVHYKATSNGHKGIYSTAIELFGRHRDYAEAKRLYWQTQKQYKLTPLSRETPPLATEREVWLYTTFQKLMNQRFRRITRRHA